MLRSPALTRAWQVLARSTGFGLEDATAGIGSGISGTAATSLVILVLNLGSGVVQARGLGAAGRGELAIAMLWPTLIAGVGGLGIQEAIVYFSGRQDNGSAAVLSSGLAVGALQTAILAGMGYLLLPLILAGKPQALLAEADFYLLILPLYPLSLYPMALLQGRLDLGTFNLARLSVNVFATALLSGLLLARQMTVHTALAASLLATAGTCVLANAIVAARGQLTWPPQVKLITELVWFGSKLHVGNVVAIVVQRLDLAMLSLLVGSAALGSYAVATSAAMVASLLPTAASMVLYPTVTRQGAGQVAHSLASLLLAAFGLSVVGSPVLVGLLPPAVGLVYGSGFALAVPLTAFLSVGYLCRGWSLMLAAVLRGIGRPFSASICQAVELPVLAGLLLALAPRLGTLGAAFAVIAGAVASTTSLLAVALWATGLSPLALLRWWRVDFNNWKRLRPLIREETA